LFPLQLHAANSQLFRYNFTDGQQLKLIYTLTATTTINGNDLHFKFGGEETLSIKKTGNDRFIITIKNQKFFNTLENKKIDPTIFGMLPQNSTMIIEVDSQGNVIDFIQRPTKDFKYAFIFPLPQKALKLGENWKQIEEIEVPIIGKVTVTSDLKLTSITSAQAIMDGRIDLKDPSHRLRTIGRQKLRFDVTNGLVTRGKSKTKSDIKLKKQQFENSTEFVW
jgi:hypothetical protein